MAKDVENKRKLTPKNKKTQHLHQKENTFMADLFKISPLVERVDANVQIQGRTTATENPRAFNSRTRKKEKKETKHQRQNVNIGVIHSKLSTLKHKKNKKKKRPRAEINSNDNDGAPVTKKPKVNWIGENDLEEEEVTEKTDGVSGNTDIPRTMVYSDTRITFLVGKMKTPWYLDRMKRCCRGYYVFCFDKTRLVDLDWRIDKKWLCLFHMGPAKNMQKALERVVHADSDVQEKHKLYATMDYNAKLLFKKFSSLKAEYQISSRFESGVGEKPVIQILGLPTTKSVIMVIQSLFRRFTEQIQWRDIGKSLSQEVDNSFVISSTASRNASWRTIYSFEQGFGLYKEKSKVGYNLTFELRCAGLSTTDVANITNNQGLAAIMRPPDDEMSITRRIKKANKSDAKKCCVSPSRVSVV